MSDCLICGAPAKEGCGTQEAFLQKMGRTELLCCGCCSAAFSLDAFLSMAKDFLADVTGAVETVETTLDERDRRIVDLLRKIEPRQIRGTARDN